MRSDTPTMPAAHDANESSGAPAIAVTVSRRGDGTLSVEALIAYQPTGPGDEGSAQRTSLMRRNRDHARTTTPPREASRTAVDEQLVNVTVVVAGPVPSRGAVDVRCVDSSHANALRVYDAYGSPPYPNASVLAQLHSASQLSVERVPIGPSPTGGKRSWAVTVTMEPFSVVSLSFEVPASMEAAAAGVKVAVH